MIATAIVATPIHYHSSDHSPAHLPQYVVSRASVLCGHAVRSYSEYPAFLLLLVDSAQLCVKDNKIVAFFIFRDMNHPLVHAHFVCFSGTVARKFLHFSHPLSRPPCCLIAPFFLADPVISLCYAHLGDEKVEEETEGLLSA